MFILYNDQLLPEPEFKLPHTDRAFQYNDGFFETAIVEQGKIRFWKDHQQRMQEAAKALHMELPDYFLTYDFAERLLQLAQEPEDKTYGRLKLKVWRAGAGLYSPQTNQVNWLATYTSTTPASHQPLQIGICRNVHTAYTSVSHFKGPNAPLYVLAGVEKQSQQQDDMLLLNQQGIVAELISSNIFWLKGSTLYTPSLQTGCVNGILRRNIIRWCNHKNLTLQQVLQKPEALFQSDVVFSANVTGVRAIASINGAPVQQREELLLRIREGLNL
ncbi:aminotransferase class IV [Pontibacter anaerobius]|uniref:branched-chain-amino-acid transaminase n=1 Tax=Pontibacter anaerobius TaxID=2993940 RepID=A0ABT3RCP4_9BACT|nr:aminotransferase class IV [Pontibacter anaerobius]MCX2739291.1 aminotransferase class IV [Pontibacter anaerobius]